MRLPVERFWTLGRRGRKKSYYNSRFGCYEDEVEVNNGVAHYYLLENEIATFDGKILSLTTAGYDTQTTWWRLSYIIDYGRSLGFRIPVYPMQRKPYSHVVKIYWDGPFDYFLPLEYPLRIDVMLGEVLTPTIKVIPTDVIPPSRSKRENAVIRRRNGGYYIIKDGRQYMIHEGRLYRLEDEDWLWVEEKNYEVMRELANMQA